MEVIRGYFHTPNPVTMREHHPGQLGLEMRATHTEDTTGSRAEVYWSCNATLKHELCSVHIVSVNLRPEHGGLEADMTPVPTDAAYMEDLGDDGFG